MRTTVGYEAPSIAVEAYDPSMREPRTIALDELRGGWVVLVFYPRDFTFVCPTELVAYGELCDAFEREDAVLLAASTDSYWCHRAWFSSTPGLDTLTYPVLADTTHELSRLFGVLTTDGSALRGTFIIDPQGVVRHASVTDQSVGRGADETLRVLQALQTGELCPANWRPGNPTLVAA
jgi:alkyl hydroperoxide reductase subunit AhpC